MVLVYGLVASFAVVFTNFVYFHVFILLLQNMTTVEYMKLEAETDMFKRQDFKNYSNGPVFNFRQFFGEKWWFYPFPFILECKKLFSDNYRPSWKWYPLGEASK